MGIDPAFGSSNFAITVTALVDDKVRVVYSEGFERPDHTSMVSLCADLKYRCVHAYIDGAIHLASLNFSTSIASVFDSTIRLYFHSGVSFNRCIQVL
jgi:hypothetical protein